MTDPRVGLHFIEAAIAEYSVRLGAKVPVKYYVCMRQTVFAFLIILCTCLPISPQSAESPDKLMAKTRALYDAPFTRNLAAFDCAVQFDWKNHFLNMLGTIPPQAMPMIDRLQTIQHRINVDHTHSTVTSIPKTPDFTETPSGATMEQALDSMVSSGLNAWLPLSTDGILPHGSTNITFEKLSSGYKITITGQAANGEILLDPDFRITSGVMQPPQSIRFATEFKSGPQGYVLTSVKTDPINDTGSDNTAIFAYTYQTVDEFQIPAQITITPATTRAWQFQLTDCKVVKFIRIQTGLPKN
jgi:hypothetical protein